MRKAADRFATNTAPVPPGVPIVAGIHTARTSMPVKQNTSRDNFFESRGFNKMRTRVYRPGTKGQGRVLVEERVGFCMEASMGETPAMPPSPLSNDMVDFRVWREELVIPLSTETFRKSSEP